MLADTFFMLRILSYYLIYLVTVFHVRWRRLVSECRATLQVCMACMYSKHQRGKQSLLVEFRSHRGRETIQYSTPRWGVFCYGRNTAAWWIGSTVFMAASMWICRVRPAMLLSAVIWSHSQRQTTQSTTTTTQRSCSS